MTIEDAEKLTISKYIAERIRKEDSKHFPTPYKRVRFLCVSQAMETQGAYKDHRCRKTLPQKVV